MSGTDARRRVKLYALNEARQWDDKGTGHVTSCYHEPLDGMSLLVRNESDGSLLLESKIQLETQYQKQQGTLIVWTESDNHDLALSFQEVDGCNEIWEKICEVQGKDPSYEANDEEEPEEIKIDLVSCDADNLQLLSEQITAFSQTNRRREMLADEFISHEYITKLLDIFKTSEEKQDSSALHKLYEIFKQLFLYDKTTLIEEMLSDDNLMNVIGVFEFDPQVTRQSLDERKRHREYLENDTTFREVIPFCNQKIVDKIHQTYRVQYLQSSVLPAPSIIDENAYSTLTNILFFNKVEIVSMIQENGEFLKTLFNQIISNETDIERKRDLVLFLKEFCTFSHTIQPKQRDGFFKTLTALGILSAIEVALQITDPVIKSAAIDIFTYLVEYSPNITREHAVQQQQQEDEDEDDDDNEEQQQHEQQQQHLQEQEEGSEAIVENGIENKPQAANLLKLVIGHITGDTDPELGTSTQLSCIIRLLLDPENIAGESRDKSRFLEFFYKNCMRLLVEPIETAVSNGELSSSNHRSTAQLLSIVLDLLTFFVEHHQMHLRNYLLTGDLLAKIITLLKSRHTFLRLSVIKFVRRLVGTEMYSDLIVSKNLLSPIMEVFKENQGRYNLLDSAILEMFEHIQSKNMLDLMDYTFQNFGDFLNQIDYVNTFKNMKKKRDSLLENLKESSRIKSDESNVEEGQMLISYSNRRLDRTNEDLDNMWAMESAPDDDDVNELDTDADRDLDADSGDAVGDPDSSGLNDIEISMNSDKNDDEIEELDEEDDIEMDEEDCDHELEPQFKKKRMR